MEKRGQKDKSQSRFILDLIKDDPFVRYKDDIVVVKGKITQTQRFGEVNFYLTPEAFNHAQLYYMAQLALEDKDPCEDVCNLNFFSTHEFMPAGNIRAYTCTQIPGIDEDNMKNDILFFYDLSLYLFRKPKDLNMIKREQVKIAEFCHEEFHKLYECPRVNVCVEDTAQIFDDYGMPYLSKIRSKGTDYIVEVRLKDERRENDYRHCVTVHPSDDLLDKVRIFPNLYDNLDTDWHKSLSLFDFLSDPSNSSIVSGFQARYARQDLYLLHNPEVLEMKKDGLDKIIETVA